MEQQLQAGQQVTVKATGGRTPVVTVVEDRGDVVLVCKPAEYEQAKAENRQPVFVGFHRADIIDIVPPKKSPASDLPSPHRGSRAGD